MVKYNKYVSRVKFTHYRGKKQKHKTMEVGG